MIARVLAVCAVVCCVSSVGSAGSVVDIVSSNNNLTTLTTLLKQADLVTALSGDGPFTVFAPTNDAFGKMPSWMGTFLTASENADILSSYLKYHVSPANLTSSSFYATEKIATLQGSHVFINYIDGTTNLGMSSATCEKNVMFEGTQVVGSNGIVHVIDTVLSPPAVILPDQLFFVEQRGQARVGVVGYDCRSKGTTTITDGQTKPVGIAVDSKAKQVFWSNDLNSKPFDSWLSTDTFAGGPSKIFLQNVYDPQGMDADLSSQKLYFTAHQGNQVKTVNYDGTAEATFWQGGASDYPADVAVDHEAGLVFFTVQSDPTILNGSLHVQHIDGTGHAILETGLIKNYGVCVDTHAKHVYYVQGGHGGSISCFAYGSTHCNTADGSNGAILTGLQYPYMCDIDNTFAPYGGPTRIIFSEPNVPGSVYVAQNNGSHIQLLSSDFDAPMGVKLGSQKFFA